MTAAYGSVSTDKRASKRIALSFHVEEVVGRIVDCMPKDPVRIDTRIVQDDSRFPGDCR
jgi:hypothetical protein